MPEATSASPPRSGRRCSTWPTERSLGTHPYFIDVQHTRFARERVGPGAIVAPEVAVVVETDPDVARRIAREYAASYLQLPNYTNNLCGSATPSATSPTAASTA